MKVKWRLVNRNLFIRYVLCLSELLRRSPFDWRNWQASVWRFRIAGQSPFILAKDIVISLVHGMKIGISGSVQKVQEVELKIMIKVCESSLFHLGFV